MFQIIDRENGNKVLFETKNYSEAAELVAMANAGGRIYIKSTRVAPRYIP